MLWFWSILHILLGNTSFYPKWNELTWASWRSKSTATRLFVQQLGLHQRNHQIVALLTLCDGNPFQCHNIIISMCSTKSLHYTDFIISLMASQITSLTIVYPTVYSRTDQRKHQSSVSLAYVREFTWDQWIPRTKGSKAENFPFDNVIMLLCILHDIPCVIIIAVQALHKLLVCFFPLGLPITWRPSMTFIALSFFSSVLRVLYVLLARLDAVTKQFQMKMSYFFIRARNFQFILISTTQTQKTHIYI